MTALLCAGCSAKEQKTDSETVLTQKPEQGSTSTPLPELSKEPTPEPTEKPNITPEPELSQEGQNPFKASIPVLELEQYEIPATDALAFTKAMKVGWNLGNTLDATVEDPWFDDELKYESAWCGVATTKAMIDQVKKAGFQTVRIPVSWHNHVSGEDFTISQVWLDRVQEVVDYVIDNGMYVILNIHHDIDVNYYYPSKEHLESSSKYMASIWTQIASRFADYDDHLIFEAINEPRLVGTNYEWWLDVNNESCKEAVDCINQLNQVFVDTVRAGSGRNSERYLMVPGYCASLDGALHSDFQLPSDPAKERLIVSVHAYTPYNFALQAPSEQGSTEEFHVTETASTREIDSLMKRLYDTYISKGIPVVIGEFGARAKSGNLEDRVEYAAYYIAAARARGITCCWWDNNAFLGNGENFGLFDRKANCWNYEEIVSALMQYAN